MNKKLRFLTIGLVYIFAVSLGALSWMISSLPKVDQLQGCLKTSIYSIWLCDKSPNYVKLQNISPYFKNLTIVAEDTTFYSHNGFDLAEIKNSFEQNWLSFKFARGGSTITQQLVKNVFLSKEKTILRKIKEAYLAYQVESLFSKDQILEKYFNVIELGPKIYGVKAAANRYFQKYPSELNLVESAFLTYLIPNPINHSRVFTNQKLSPYSRYRILDLCYRLYRFGKISENQYLAAKSLVDQFPWNTLSDLDRERLSNPDLIASPVTLDTQPNLPESDQSLEVVPIDEIESSEDISTETLEQGAESKYPEAVNALPEDLDTTIPKESTNDQPFTE